MLWEQAPDPGTPKAGLVPGFLAVAALLLSGAAGLQAVADSAEVRWSASGPSAEPARQIRYAPRLLANVSVAERYVAVGVCESGGIREISEILVRSEFEEMWAFLPRARGTPECEWHEIGRDEKSDRDNAYLRVDMAYLEALMAENTEVHVVHFHPLKFFECLTRTGCPEVAAARQAEFPDARWVTDLVFSMPSPSDVHFMMDVTSRFHARHRGRGTIRHKVVTPYGIVDYGLTDAGLAKFNAERYGRSEGLYIAWVMASKLANDQVEGVIKDNPGSIHVAVQKLAQTLNTEFLRVIHSTLAPASAQ